MSQFQNPETPLPVLPCDAEAARVADSIIALEGVVAALIYDATAAGKVSPDRAVMLLEMLIDEEPKGVR